MMCETLLALHERATVSVLQLVLLFNVTSPPEEGGNLTLLLRSPPGYTFAPLGFYMLFVLAVGTPSHAEYVQVKTTAQMHDLI